MVTVMPDKYFGAAVTTDNDFGATVATDSSNFNSFKLYFLTRF